jgi:cell division protein FtsB
MFQTRPTSNIVLRKTRVIIPPFLVLCVGAYFAFHTVQGDHGLIALSQTQNQIRQAEATLAALESERDHLDKKVARLRPDQLDLDLLDEEARKSLGYTASGDIVVLKPQPTIKKQTAK